MLVYHYNVIFAVAESSTLVGSSLTPKHKAVTKSLSCVFAPCKNFQHSLIFVCNIKSSTRLGSTLTPKYKAVMKSLACVLVPCKTFQHCIYVMFMCNTRSSTQVGFELPFKIWTGTNALAYLSGATVTKKKRLIISSPDGHVLPFPGITFDELRSIQ